MRLLGSLFLLLWLLGCTAATPNIANSLPASGGWEIGSPAAAGFDTRALERLSHKLETGGHPNTHSLLVEYDGRLVYEKYLSGRDQIWGSDGGHREFDVDSLHDLRSISKSVTALLLGIALGDEFASALQKPVIEYFPELRSRASPGADAITLHHALTMTTGQEWNEMDVPYSNRNNDEIRLYSSGDPFAYVLAKPLKREPGEAWYYHGGTTMLLAGVVEAVSGKKFLDFAHESLFEPLGIEPRNLEWKGQGIFWQRDLKLPSAASGLRLRARDLAKIGSLMLHDGRWQGRQVVPPAWIRISSQRHTEQTNPKWSMGGTYGYGYQWWHGNFRGQNGLVTAISGVGYGGQRLFVVPQKKLVVTVFAGNYGTGHWRVSENILAEIIAAAP